MEGTDGLDNGAPGELTCRRYERFAKGGAGLIWFEAVATVPEGRASAHQLRITPENVGEYKRLPNEVGGIETTPPEEVHTQIKSLLKTYNAIKNKTLEDIIDFHCQFERIHPFQDGNGRVGRLIMFKECLANNIVPFIITDELKLFYYRGLSEWGKINGYLTDTCLTAQDHYKALLDYFKIRY
jgi:hypothetical protein